MRLCPKCGSKELQPVVFGKKTDHSKIIQKKIDDGEYLLVRKEPVDHPNLACKSCGFKWRVGELPLKYLKKVRFKLDEFGTNGLKSGDRIIEIFPDGRVRYYAHTGSETKASASVSGKVTKKRVNELLKKLDEIKNNAASDFTYGLSCNLQMLYVDNDKFSLDGDYPDGRICSSIMEVAGAVPKIKVELDTPFQDVAVPDDSAGMEDEQQETPAEEIDTEALEDTLNEILPGLTMYVRDVDLDETCAKMYIPETILLERGFTDASSRVKGMKTTHRISILSNHMADLSDFEHGTEWGLYVANHHSHFKVLDVYQYQGKTQILLLHLPDDERWKIFQSVKISIEEQLIEDSRKRFENKCTQDVIPDLAAQEWLDRCRQPIGMDTDGNLFDPYEPVQYPNDSVVDLDYHITVRVIMQQLTEDNEKNIAWLSKAMDRYKDHPRGREIIKACARKLYELLPEDQRKRLDDIVGREMDTLDERMDKIRGLIIEKKAQEAKPLMDALAKEADENPLFREDEVSQFFLFREWFEECLYRHIYEPKKELRRAQYPYDEIYAMQGSMYIDLKDLEKARECLKKALAWNPVNARISFEYAETFKIEGDMAAFFEESKKIQKISLHTADVARFLRNIGYYFIETGQYHEAMMCYMRSLYYDCDSKVAENEINGLYKMCNVEIEMPMAEECRAFTEKYGFPLGADNELLSMMYAYGKHFLDNQEKDGAAYCFGLFYELTDDPEVKKILDQLGVTADEDDPEIYEDDSPEQDTEDSPHEESAGKLKRKQDKSEKETDISCRNKDYTYKVSIGKLPANDEQMSTTLMFPGLVKERKDVSVLICLNDE